MAAKQKPQWGGARSGAGRPKGSGSGPSPDARKNRIAVMLSDADLRVLDRAARKQKSPVATLAYELLAKGLKKLR